MSQIRQLTAIEHPSEIGSVGAGSRVAGSVPVRGGVGLKAEHYNTILEDKPDVGWFEIHAENYMGAGGPPHRYLSAVRQDYPISVHGVGMSIGADRPLDVDHLARLRAVVDRYDPGLFSEHLAWSTHNSFFYNDLLPVPYNEDAVKRVVEHVDQIQQAVGRRLLLENPSTYLVFVESTMNEVDFLSEVARRSGCGLLLDVNNVFVSATNQHWDPVGYIDAFPVDLVGEIHLAGHAPALDDNGDPLLIDAHDRPVSDPVWVLYEHAIKRTGPLPTLIEWDNEVPPWSALSAEAARADAVLAAGALGKELHAVAG
jgi:uncharacterized protein (UPF0276 family)